MPPIGNLPPNGGLPRWQQQYPDAAPAAPGSGSKWSWLGPLMPILGGVATAWIDKRSQDSANKANAQNVQAQIDFQREQNATAYQRAIADLKAAGLNPALAYKQGGANSGSGAAADYKPSLSQSHQRLMASVAAYNEFANGTAQRQVIREQAGLTAAQTRKTLLEGNAIQPDSMVGTSGDYQHAYFKSRLSSVRAAQFTADKVPERYDAELKGMLQGTATARQQEQLMKTQATLNEQMFMNEWYRKNIAPYINSTAKTIEGIGAVMRTGRGLTGYTPTSRYY